MAEYTFLTVHRPSPAAMAAALAEVMGATVAEVDVADESGEHRDWTAAVLCDRMSLAGDLALCWDVRVAPRVGPAPPAEAEAALRLAARLGTTVLHPAAGVRPSAYWAATPDGIRTRARVLDEDGTGGEGPTSLTVDAVEKPVGQLPRARVEPILEAGQDG
ncbi:hypothetical protein C5F59_014330 [Streptomyces sp. QL37]|uniref:hypothetical protein n=1 Tax=Streptomyces sp. QL37 TaxID=2093747 RepID=UPI000CF219A2|nr:hypothetical protein [Streptomyces sp. QL37]PPQ59447.1 hypothetical protein C5F59_24360 [Streptomyces sp. QL37]